MDATTEQFDRNVESEKDKRNNGLTTTGGVALTPIGGDSPVPANVLGRVDLSGAAQINAEPTVEVTLQSLLQAGVHFGHQTSRWHPNMAQFIHSTRNGIHIINLPKTMERWKDARRAVVECIANGGSILFVGTKKQAQTAIIEEAKRCGAFFVARRWLGGMLTNFQTIRKSIERLKKVELLLGDEEQRKRYTKKELLMMDREREKLEFSLGGIRDLHSQPQVMFVVDIKREDIAIKEAQRLDIPVIALVDTNCDPDIVDYAIPSNDDATRSIKLFSAAIADAVQEGRVIRAQRGPSKDELARNVQASQKPAQSEQRPNKRRNNNNNTRQKVAVRGVEIPTPDVEASKAEEIVLSAEAAAGDDVA